MKFKILSVFWVLFFSVFFLFGEELTENVSQDDGNQITKEVPASKIRIYIENSYSMAAYYKENDMNLSDSINNLITKLSAVYRGENIEIYSIADDKAESLTADYNSKDDMDELFHSNVNFQVKRDACSYSPSDPRCDSKLNKIVGKILNDTHGETISLLVSDLIYSIPKESGNLEKILPKLQGDTEQVFLRKRQENKNFAAVLVRLMVKFNGTYYNYKNVGRSNSKPRPVYILAVGDKTKLLKFFKDKETVKEKLNNFQDIAYFMSYNSEDSSFANDFTVLPMLNNEKINPGRIEKGDPIHVVYDWENVSEFYIASNVNCFNVESDKAENYSGKNVAIENADKFNLDTLDPANRRFIEEIGKKYTHILKVKKDSTIGLKDVEINLKDWDLNKNEKNIPWVSGYSTSDDVNDFKPETTFGLAFFVKGVDAAFRGGNSKYDSCFSLKLNVGHSDEAKERSLPEWLLTFFFSDNPDDAWFFKYFPTLFGRISSAFIWFCLVLLVVPLLFILFYFYVVNPSNDKMMLLCLTMLASSLFCYVINIILAYCVSNIEVFSSTLPYPYFMGLLLYLFTEPMILSVFWFFVLSFLFDCQTKLGAWKTVIKTNDDDNLPEEEEDE